VDTIKAGFQAFVADGGEEFGAIRAVSPHGELTVYVENAGDFTVPMHAVTKVEFGKVIFDCKRLGGKLRRAIGHAHDAETE
jgi:hypothetical protein